MNKTIEPKWTKSSETIYRMKVQISYKPDLGYDTALKALKTDTNKELTQS